MLLHDLASRTRRERIALRGQIRTGDGLGDHRQLIDVDAAQGAAGRGELNSIQTGADRGAADQRSARGRSSHAVDAQYIADAVHDADGRIGVSRLRLGDRLRDYLLDIGDREKGGRIRAAAGTTDIGGSRSRSGGGHRGAPAAAGGERRRGQRPQDALLSFHRATSSLGRSIVIVGW